VKFNYLKPNTRYNIGDYVKHFKIREGVYEMSTPKMNREINENGYIRNRMLNGNTIQNCSSLVVIGMIGRLDGKCWLDIPTIAKEQ